jgi:hypothetical protein
MSFYAGLIFAFSLGVLVGYMWRDRISRARRARYRAARYRAEQEARYLEEQKRGAQGYAAITSDPGVDHQTVDVVRAKPEDGGEIPHHAEVAGKDGISQPREKRAGRKPMAPKAPPS